MRRFFVRIISLLMVCSVLISFVGCGNDKTTASDSSSITSNVVSSDVTSTDTSIEIDKEILEKYSYFPVVSEVMPIIHINTKDGLNAFATQFRREDKMAGLIDYVDATIAVTECEDEFAFSDIEAEVKVRGNYTLNYDKKPIRIKFSKKQNLLGLHNGEKYKNWVLLADWKDLSMSNKT